MKKNQTKPYIPQSRQLAQKLIKKIHDGDYAPGERLESIYALAAKYGVGRQVALSAVSLLSKQNYVYSVRGSGVYLNPQLKPGLYYRIGWFFNLLNPAGSCYITHCAYQCLAREGFSMIIGSNFEENFTFRDWLEKKSDLDGVIITGLVDEELLKYPARHCIPFVVYGNYNISDKHPQVLYNFKEVFQNDGVEFFRKHQWRSLAIIGGLEANRADQEILETIREVVLEAGVKPSDFEVINAGADGYAELEKFFSRRIPEAIIFIGEHIVGFQKYCYNHPEFKRPKVIILQTIKDKFNPEVYDFLLPVTRMAEQKTEEAIKMLISQITQSTISMEN